MKGEDVNPAIPGRGKRRYLTPMLPEADQIEMAKGEYAAGRISIERFEHRVEVALCIKPAESWR